MQDSMVIFFWLAPALGFIVLLLIGLSLVAVMLSHQISVRLLYLQTLWTEIHLEIPNGRQVNMYLLNIGCIVTVKFYVSLHFVLCMECISCTIWLKLNEINPTLEESPYHVRA